jgi:diguanylate cyclase
LCRNDDPNGVGLHNLTERTVLPFVRPGYEDVSTSASRECDGPIARPSAVDIESLIARLGTLGDLDAHETAAILVSLATECIQLRASLSQEMQHQNALQGELHDVKRTLAQARADLLSHHDDVKQARYMAMHDCLTNLPNRAFFCLELDCRLAVAELHRKSIAVFFIDLDGFKAVNDLHGHPAGDELLKMVAMRITRTLRAEDMVSRLGGDEFGCLLSGFPSRDQLQHLASKLFDAVSVPLNVGDVQLAVRPSIGIAIFPDHGVTGEALLRNADAAMYHCKKQRKTGAFFYESA